VDFPLPSYPSLGSRYPWFPVAFILDSSDCPYHFLVDWILQFYHTYTPFLVRFGLPFVAFGCWYRLVPWTCLPLGFYIPLLLFPTVLYTYTATTTYSHGHNHTHTPLWILTFTQHSSSHTLVPHNHLDSWIGSFGWLHTFHTTCYIHTELLTAHWFPHGHIHTGFYTSSWIYTALVPWTPQFTPHMLCLFTLPSHSIPPGSPSHTFLPWFPSPHHCGSAPLPHYLEWYQVFIADATFHVGALPLPALGAVRWVPLPVTCLPFCRYYCRALLPLFVLPAVE